ncbi:MAG: nuclear transport factor 2 family protein [Acidimicrobiales bacterium]
MSTEPGEVVRALWQRIWIDGELDALGDLVADPYVRHTRQGTLVQDPATYGESVAAAIEVIRGTKVVLDDIVTVGETVWARMTLHAVNINMGDQVRITWMGQYRIADGKVAESWVLHETGLDWS